MIEADNRLRAHERLMRKRKALARDAEVWRKYEEDYLEREADALIQQQQQRQQQQQQSQGQDSK
jgi:hypothetical protein